MLGNVQGDREAGLFAEFRAVTNPLRLEEGGELLGGGLEPPCLAACAPQTHVSAISPPERDGQLMLWVFGSTARGKFKKSMRSTCWGSGSWTVCFIDNMQARGHGGEDGDFC